MTSCDERSAYNNKILFDKVCVELGISDTLVVDSNKKFLRSRDATLFPYVSEGPSAASTGMTNNMFILEFASNVQVYVHSGLLYDTKKYCYGLWIYCNFEWIHFDRMNDKSPIDFQIYADLDGMEKMCRLLKEINKLTIEAQTANPKIWKLLKTRNEIRSACCETNLMISYVVSEHNKLVNQEKSDEHILNALLGQNHTTTINQMIFLLKNKFSSLKETVKSNETRYDELTVNINKLFEGTDPAVLLTNSMRELCVSYHEA